ncbi:unnamed protein product [Amoebophrya sp. A120]|nr:unnamed protein product [Amoebophrya sp. A120]|eukprot:GSA120T00000906001.1
MVAIGSSDGDKQIALLAKQIHDKETELHTLREAQDKQWVALLQEKEAVIECLLRENAELRTRLGENLRTTTPQQDNTAGAEQQENYATTLSSRGPFRAVSTTPDGAKEAGRASREGLVQQQLPGDEGTTLSQKLQPTLFWNEKIAGATTSSLPPSNLATQMSRIMLEARLGAIDSELQKSSSSASDARAKRTSKIVNKNPFREDFVGSSAVGATSASSTFSSSSKGTTDASIYSTDRFYTARDDHTVGSSVLGTNYFSGGGGAGAILASTPDHLDGTSTSNLRGKSTSTSTCSAARRPSGSGGSAPSGITKFQFSLDEANDITTENIKSCYSAATSPPQWTQAGCAISNTGGLSTRDFRPGGIPQELMEPLSIDGPRKSNPEPTELVNRNDRSSEAGDRDESQHYSTDKNTTEATTSRSSAREKTTSSPQAKTSSSVGALTLDQQDRAVESELEREMLELQRRVTQAKETMRQTVLQASAKKGGDDSSTTPSSLFSRERGRYKLETARVDHSQPQTHDVLEEDSNPSNYSSTAGASAATHGAQIGNPDVDRDADINKENFTPAASTSSRRYNFQNSMLASVTKSDYGDARAAAAGAAPASRRSVFANKANPRSATADESVLLPRSLSQRSLSPTGTSTASGGTSTRPGEFRFADKLLEIQKRRRSTKR